jgi:diguanylate cyclase (GGDEF)-like protein
MIAGIAVGFAAAVPLLWHQRSRTDRWRHLATHDDVTGLPNRRALTSHLRQCVADGRRPGVVLVDLDRFKAVNDTFGHEAGNDLLRRVADRLLTLDEPVSLLGRLSGDEFVAVIDDGTLEQTAAAAHDVAAAISGLPYRVGDDLVEVAASVGYTPGRPGISARQLLRQADYAMYVAKQGGRGRVHGHLLANDQTSSCLRPARYRDRR